MQANNRDILQSWTIVLGHFNLHVWGTFQFTQVQPLPPFTPQTMLNGVSRTFSKFQLCIGWGKGELQENFKKDALFKREPRNDRKIWILQYCPKDFCPGLSESWFWGKKSVFFIFPTLSRHFGDKLVITCNNNDLWNYFLNIASFYKAIPSLAILSPFP